MAQKIKRLLPFIILIGLIFVVYLTDLHKAFTIDWLRAEQHKLASFVADHPVLSPLIYVGFYIASVCLIIPDSTILTLLGGLVFPLPLAVIYAVFSETVGATTFFAIFHSFFGNAFLDKERPFMKRVRKGFKKNSVNYLLFLRLSHILPFWLTNLFAAYFKVPYKTFIWTTLVGVIPLTWILAEAGNSLAALFATDAKLHIGDLLTTQVKIALIALGIVALFPIIYKYFIARKK